MSKVKFSVCSKSYDGSSPMKDEIYSLIGSFYGIRENNIKKIGMSSEDIDKCISLYLNNKKTTEGLSDFLRMIIKSKKISSDKLHPVLTVLDVVKYDYFTIVGAIENLKSALSNAMDKIKEKLINEHEELNNPVKYREKDEEWERTCGAPVCYERRCCLDKKAKRKCNYKTSLIRTGSRDYSLMLSIDNIDNIRKLIDLLEMGEKFSILDRDRRSKSKWIPNKWVPTYFGKEKVMEAIIVSSNDDVEDENSYPAFFNLK